MDVTDREITAFLDAVRIDQDVELDALFADTYARLRGLAHAQRLRWSGQETLSTTVLVHEAYLKLSAQESARWESRTHFFAVAARAMRHILINYAERCRAEKRGGDSVHLPVETVAPARELPIEELLDLDEALRGLERLSPRRARVVECRFFAGLNVEETAETLAISTATVKRDWRRGQAWLYRELASRRSRTPGGAAPA